MSPSPSVRPAVPSPLPAAGRAGTVIAVVTALSQAVAKGRQWWSEHLAYRVTVTSEDVIYQDVHDWLLELIPGGDRRALVARSSIDRGGDEIVPADGLAPQPATRLLLASDDRHARMTVIGGQRVQVWIDRPDDAAVDARGRLRLTPDKIVFRASTATGQDAVVAELERIVAARSQARRQPTVWLMTSWGSWRRRPDLPLRPMDSVILAAGQRERLLTDVERFLASEPDYVRRGQPYHRGYLLHGQPGGGKTSIARALADHFGLDLWYAPLADLEGDATLMNLLSEVHPRSILLLEDVDTLAAVKDADRDADGAARRITIGGLLNALDGVATPHGLIVVMTTNRPDVLDPAMVRPGRIDLVEEVALPDAEQARRAFAAHYGHQPLGAIDPAGRSMAALIEVFVRHGDDPAGAERALRPQRAAQAVTRVAVDLAGAGSVQPMSDPYRPSRTVGDA